MRKEEVLRSAVDFVSTSAANHVAAETALSPDFVGMRLFDAPIMGVAAAGDPLFEDLRNETVIGAHFKPPPFWLEDARSVICFFLPLTRRIIEANRKDRQWPAPEWLHGRMEGQSFLNILSAWLAKGFEEAGHKALVPFQDPRYLASDLDTPISDGGGKPRMFTSNWSERHAAFIAGLGTLSLSRGLITKKGTAGRLFSLITSLELEPDLRPYSRHDEYCRRCGACIRQCPTSAISLEHGKDQVKCALFLAKTLEFLKTRYGCGKCQVDVPCERRLPD